ncbi:FAD-dependent oxidoreductase, partial [Salinibacterium sp.]|uniref:NAD(P)/FAD-dependent oxidoreductase n=1 Tax=Salinibacterium sp. TaxID=1915057 RepID=UPI00286A02B0
AQALRSAGVAARVMDRGRKPGGRMASRTIHGRTVDLGAAYFTAEPGSRFADVVAGWLERGLARPWTDTIAVAGAGGIHRSSTGPMRYAAAAGLRELVVDLARGIELEQGVTVNHVAQGEVDGERYDTVVLAMPDPQARRMLDAASTLRQKLDDGSGWEPSIAVVLEWAAREWPPFHAAFINEVPELTTISDDGDRRGDGAPVLVAHTTADLARQHLDDPDGAIAPAADAVRRLLTLPDAPMRSFAHRWSFARPASQHPEPFLLTNGIGVCGDAWGERSSVGTAWASGDALGRAIAGG